MSEPVKLELVGDTLDNHAPAPPVDEPGGGYGNSGKGRRDDGLPDACPVIPLGVLGDENFFLDANKQLRRLKGEKHGQSSLKMLFGQWAGMLHHWWPRYNKNGETVGWRPEECATDLIVACAKKGVWSPAERIRGAGAWVGRDGQLVLHCGDAIVECPIAGPRVVHVPGLIAGMVYPASPPTHKPHVVHNDAGMRAAEQVLELFETWNFRRPVDARLLLGWVGAAMIGGALTWRPHVWVSGGSGSGKSTLQEVLGHLFGSHGLVAAADTTAAGVWQRLGYSSQPVSLDEAEPEGDPRQNQALLKFARYASSGAKVLRGGADHNGQEFTARSAFMYSSILKPPMMAQDRSRITDLELMNIPPGSQRPRVVQAEIEDLGRLMLGRLAVMWPRLADVLEIYRQALMDAGHNSRGADQLGTLLACVDVLLHDEPPDSDSLAEVVAPLSGAALAEFDDDAPDTDLCLAHLLTSIIDPYRGGGRSTLAEWIAKARIVVRDPTDDDGKKAQQVISTYGCRVVPGGDGGCGLLAVANYHQGLAAIYDGTHWAGRAGASGVWRQALSRLPGATRSPRTVRFGESIARATLIPIDRVLPNGDQCGG